MSSLFVCDLAVLRDNGMPVELRRVANDTRFNRWVRMITLPRS